MAKGTWEGALEIEAHARTLGINARVEPLWDGYGVSSATIAQERFLMLYESSDGAIKSLKDDLEARGILVSVDKVKAIAELALEIQEALKNNDTAHAVQARAQLKRIAKKL